MASLKDLATAAEIRYAINNLRQGSDSYKSAYETAIQRIRGQSVSRTKLANKVLAWIVYTKRVLKASELRLALGVEVGKRILDYDSCPDVDMMVSVCAGLVTIDDSADTIRLVHYTAQTFFDNVKSTMFPSAETEIVRICTTYLSLKIFAKYQHDDGYQSDSPSESEDEEPLEQHLSKLSPGSEIHNDTATYWDINSRQTLYDYAAQYWGVHARETPDAHEDVMRFLSQRSYITGAYEAAAEPCGYRYWGGDDENQESALISVDGLHLAALLGLEQAVEEILRECLYNPDVVIKLKPNKRRCNGLDEIGPYLTPLTIAAAQNHPRIVKMLLDSGATSGVVSLDEGKKYKGTTALHVASEKGFEVIVDMLLQADAISHSQRSMGDVKNLQTGQNEQSRRSTLYIGSQKGHDELERSLQYMLRPNMDLPDNYGWSSLDMTSRRDWNKIDDMLLRHVADLKSQSEVRYSPPIEFCTDGRDKGSFVLREYGDIRGASDGDLFSSLYVASANGHLPVVKILLHHGAKVDATSKQSPSPLYAACTNGYINIARILLQKGANMDAPYGSDLSPLHDAALNGHTEIFKLLLQYESGINQPNIRDRNSSYLHCASARGHVEMVKMLLEHGANTHLEKEAKLSPIHAAVENRQFEVFDLLIRYGANPNQWRGSKTPLQLALDMQQPRVRNPALETTIKRLRELGGMTSRELHLQETLELMRERREKKVSSTDQQEPVDLPEDRS
jgi:ankyrin repeat protein